MNLSFDRFQLALARLLLAAGLTGLAFSILAGLKAARDLTDAGVSVLVLVRVPPRADCGVCTASCVLLKSKRLTSGLFCSRRRVRASAGACTPTAN